MGKADRLRRSRQDEPEQPEKQSVQIPIETRVIQQVRQGGVERTEDGGAIISGVVIEGGQPIERSLVFDAEDKKMILEELAGGIALPS